MRFRKLPKTWDDSLEFYLDSSDEDSVITSEIKKWFERQRPSEWPGTTMGWIELGPGPCTKTTSLFKAFASCRGSILKDVTLIEPSERWIHRARTAAADWRSHGVPVRVLNESAQSVMTLETQLVHAEFGLVTAIHVLYEQDVAEAWVSLCKRLRGEAPIVAVSVIEDATSDFSQLRSLLAGHVSLEATAQFAADAVSALRRAGGRVETLASMPQVCTIDRLALRVEQDHWLFRFITGESASEFLRADSRRNRIVREIVRAFVEERKGTLNTPDKIDVIWM